MNGRPGTPALPWAGRRAGRDKRREYFQVMPFVLEIRAHVQALWVVDGDRVAVVRDGEIARWDAYEETEAMFNCGPWR